MAQSILKVAAGLVRGESAGGAVVFGGIRYAAALVGPDRFRPPQSARPWAGTRDAARSGPAAPEGSYPAFAGHLLPGAGIPGDGCLNLDVGTPGPAAGGVPVLVRVHGGSLAGGSGSLLEAPRHSEVTIEHVSLRTAAGGYATWCAVST